MDDIAAALADDSSSDQDDATINFQTPKKRRNAKNNAKRFSDDQIKSLESIFKVETKLEPKKKVQLAKDLGLQPRQVAIWFQNRRARWKSKQIEQDYRVLKASYDNLQLQFDDLKRENQSLQMQLQELSGLLEKVDLSDRDGEVRGNPSSQNEEMDRNDSKQVIKGFGKTEEEEMLSWDEEQEITNLAGPQTWCNLSSTGIFDQSSTTSDWWENE